MPQHTQKKTPSKKKPLKVNLPRVLGNIFDSPEEVADFLEDPPSGLANLLGRVPDAIRDANKQTSKPPRTKRKPKRPPTPGNAAQKAVQNRLTLILADNRRFGLDDILRYWQQFADEPLVDWVYETRRKSQPELAGELVRKATRQNKLFELEKAVNAVNKSRQPRVPK
jgi:hypothetical protein